jgi:hypothetical protein
VAVTPPTARTAAATDAVEPFVVATMIVTRCSPLARAWASSARSCEPSVSVRSVFLGVPFSAVAVGTVTPAFGSGSAAVAVELTAPVVSAAAASAARATRARLGRGGVIADPVGTRGDGRPVGVAPGQWIT